MTPSPITPERYPAARAISPRLHAYFASQIAPSGTDVLKVAPVPDQETIEQIVDAAFWASLRREEGFIPRISLAFLSPADAAQPLSFERPLPLDSGVLTKIAPAVERAAIHLGVWTGADGNLCVWGPARGLPRFCFVVEVAAAGLIIIKEHTGAASGKFVNVAVLEGDRIKVVSHRGEIPDYRSVLPAFLGFESPTLQGSPGNILGQLAVSMRGHGHGGSLLVVPSEGDSWRDSILSPIPYALAPPYAGLAELTHAEPEKMRRAIDAIAGLTAVDGALVLTDRYHVVGFGAKILRRRGGRQVDQVLLSEPIEGEGAALVHPEQLGGTRHLSAAQFVQDQPDSVALVASQDQRFTVFEWSAREEIVHAHRIDALLL